MNIEQNASYTDAEDTNNLNFSKNTKIIDQEEIEGTPFRRVRTEEGEFITIGVKRLTDLMGTEEGEERVKKLKEWDWKFILSVMSVLVQETVAQLHIDMMKFQEVAERGEVENG